MDNNKKRILRKYLLIFSAVLGIGCSIFLIYYLGIQPYYSRQITNKYKDIYYSYTDNVETATDETSSSESSETETDNLYILDSSYEAGAKDSEGILLKFSKLLEYNPDIKGWLNIPGTNIDYPVLQAADGSDYYLKRNFEGKKDKNGSLYIDGNSSIKKSCKNIVIHGHNMNSTGMMFHELLKYKDLSFYKKNPVLTFDTLYKESKWKVIAFIRVSGDLNAKGNFNFMQGQFEDDSDFLNFVYQIQVRSSYKCPVDVNEDDKLLMLSTCSYEVNNYRSIVVARRLRKGESPEVDVEKAYERSNVLYPDKWYKQYDGEAPDVVSFEDAMSFGEIDWYDGELTYDAAIGKVAEVDGLKYKIISKEAVGFIGCKNSKLKKLTIPSTVTFDERTYDVTNISKSAFAKMKKLKELKIGNKVTEIESKTFTECTKLESVIIGNSVKSIGKKAFYNLENLKKIKIKSKSLKTIEESAFKGISPKAKFKLPKKRYKKYHQLINSSGLSKDADFKFIKY